MGQRVDDMMNRTAQQSDQVSAATTVNKVTSRDGKPQNDASRGPALTEQVATRELLEHSKSSDACHSMPAPAKKVADDGSASLWSVEAPYEEGESPAFRRVELFPKHELL